MYRLRSTIKCPQRMKDELVAALHDINITDLDIREVPYEYFVEESRLYWDFVFPEMLKDKKPVTYISFDFPDTPEGREQSHFAEWTIGWIPQNIRYVEV